MVRIKPNRCVLQCKNNRAASVGARRSFFVDHQDDADEFFENRQQDRRLQGKPLKGKRLEGSRFQDSQFRGG
jgi:hypothetical protein